jgi:hypothetical protein
MTSEDGEKRNTKKTENASDFDGEVGCVCLFTRVRRMTKVIPDITRERYDKNRKRWRRRRQGRPCVSSL